MKMAYLILAHNNRAQLERLAARLLSGDSQDIVIIHADARSPLWADLQASPLDCGPRVHVIGNPVPVRWGHHSLVAATLRLIEAAMAQGCDYAHLLSGADWPLINREKMHSSIERESQALCHIEAVRGNMADRMAGFRMDARWLAVNEKTQPLAYSAAWKLRRLSHIIDGARAKIGLDRSEPFGPWCKGSQWWSLPADALQCLAQELPKLIASGRLAGTLCSDEHAIQTIIADRFEGRIASNQRFIQFPEGLSNPRILTGRDLPAMKESGAWFGRKMAMDQDDFFLGLPLSG